MNTTYNRNTRENQSKIEAIEHRYLRPFNYINFLMISRSRREINLLVTSNINMLHTAYAAPFGIRPMLFDSLVFVPFAQHISCGQPKVYVCAWAWAWMCNVYRCHRLPTVCVTTCGPIHHWEMVKVVAPLIFRSTGFSYQSVSSEPLIEQRTIFSTFVFSLSLCTAFSWVRMLDWSSSTIRIFRVFFFFVPFVSVRFELKVFILF